MKHAVLAAMLSVMAAPAWSCFTDMIVSDRTMEDINEAEAALKAQLKKEVSAAANRFKSGAWTDVNGAVWKYGFTVPSKMEPGARYPRFIGNTGQAGGFSIMLTATNDEGTGIEGVPLVVEGW